MTDCDLCHFWGDRVECCGCDKHICEDCREVGPDDKVRCAECHIESFPGLVAIRRTGTNTFLCIWYSGDVRRERVFVGGQRAIAFQKEAASVALMEANHRQFVQAANMAAGRELFRAHGYGSVELYRSMRERADVKVMKALGGVR